ncbi:MAG: immunoglobulin domain-containing protein [Verrucomicrobia bacterium]|nr:immunoglobulin domain-containing protein [Verrucomicrobiota bacterium]
MKNLFALLLSPALATCVGGVCFAADISGDISYSGSRTGQVHIAAQQTLPGNQVLNLGGADTVQIPGLTSLAGSELTIQFWFRGSTYQSAVRQQSSGWVIAGWNGLHILNNDGGLNGISAGDGITDGNWHHVLVTWKQGTVDGFASYLDGKLVAKRDSSNTPIPNYNASVWLGSFQNVSEFSAGQMDAIAIWQRFLSPSEIAANWNKSLRGDEPGLLAYWDFDDGTFNDKTTNHFDGTPFGSAAVVAANIPGYNGANVTATVAGPGAYSIAGLPAGAGYSITAFLDANGNGRFDAGEPAGAYAGNPFNLTVNLTGVDVVLKEPPSITLQPVAARRAVGGSIGFQVAATGTPPLSYIWYRDDVALSNDARTSGANTPSLQITGLVAGDAGGYSCLVTNGQGTAVSAAATLDVIVNGKTISGTFVYDGPQTGKVHTTVAQLRTNKALSLDGTTGSAVTTLTDMSGDELSIEYWFKGSAVTSAVRQQGGPGYIVAGWGANYHILSNDGGVAQPVKVSNPLTAVVDGNWHHVAMTWKKNTANGFASYFDGELVEQRNSGATAIPNIGAQVWFGAWNGTAEFARGQIDEIAIWSRALTRAEIRSQMRNGLTGTEANLTGYWNFDDGIGMDLTPNGNNAELRGGAAIVDAVNAGLGASYADVFAGVGPFQISAIPAGNGYSLLAYLDANGSGTQDSGEPRGAYAGNAFNLTADLSGISLTLFDPPAILTNALTVTVPVGGTIHLSVVAGGTSNTYQWQHYSTPLVDDARISGAHSTQLTITAAQLEDAGAYSILVSNLLGQIVSQPAAVIVQPASLTNGLTAYYPFDETSGTVAHEVMGLSADGQLNNFPTDNSQWVAGMVGRSLAFSDPTNLNNVIAPDYVKPTNTMAVSAWVWAASRPTWASIVKNWGNSQPGQFHFGLNGDAGQLSNYITDGASNAVSIVESVPLPLNNWQHVAFVADGARIRLYRNGLEVGVSAPYDGMLVTPTMTSLGIGAKTDNTGTVVDVAAPGYWHGKLDDLGIWCRALSADEVFGLYRAGLSGKGIAQASAVKPVTLSATLIGNQVTIHYEAGSLEWAGDLAGPWTQVPGASAPSFTTNSAALKEFFRVR